MLLYRSFRNSDPPRLLELWQTCQLGRGAALGITSDAFEILNFSQSYFEPRHLTIAFDDDKAVGFVHCGFGFDENRSELSGELGVICAVVVHPDYRRRGIGRQLIAMAEKTLAESGTQVVHAGAAEPRDPYYFGLYGGSQPAGFLESDPSAAPFFQAIGYQPTTRNLVFQRDLNESRDPVNFKLAAVRRKIDIAIDDRPGGENWWWITRKGRLDSLRFFLMPKGGGDPVAQVTAFGLDLYIPTWNERAVGLTDLFVEEQHRGQGYALTLLGEVGKRLRQELITRLEAHAAEDNIAATSLLKAAGYSVVDTGVVFTKSL